jgi:hypothetical protein
VATLCNLSRAVLRQHLGPLERVGLVAKGYRRVTIPDAAALSAFLRAG